MNLNHFYHYYKSKSGGVSNLLKASEDFTSSLDWLKKPDTDAPTITGGVTDPNGGTDAQRVNFTANKQARVQQSVTLSASTEYTFSVYARVNTGTDQFRLRNVTLSAAEAKTATTSWTRFEYTFTTTTGGVYELSIQNTENVAANIEFFGAMLNVGASANAYVKVDPSTGGSAPTPAYSGFGDVFGGVTSYYSLRKFTEAETLNAIRVRRSSDNTEQDIGFDANGDLDSTALLAFVNEDVDVYTSDFSSTEDLGEFNGTGAAAQSVGGVDDAYKFTTITGTGQMFASITPFSGKGGGNEFRVQADVYLPSTNAEIDKVRIFTGYGTEIFADVTTTDSWVSVDQTITITSGEVLRFQAYDGTDVTPTTTEANVFYLKNIVITQTTADGAVTTFYDQTGNGNDATNSTESEQPLVVSAGTLVEENSKAAILPDGIDDELQMSAQTLKSVFVVDEPETAQNGVLGGYLATMTTKLVYRTNASLENTFSGTITDQALFSVFAEGASDPRSINAFRNGTAATNNPRSLNLNTNSGHLLSRGGGGYYSKKVQEIIIFDSDQKANRTGMETNINDHFDIYTP
jgi:hypothetical protein